jgi:hypothetical protein
MAIKPFDSMRSIDPPLRDAILRELKQQGLHGPHNFVESAEGAIAGIDMGSPETRELLAGLDEIISGGNSELKRELEDF